MSNKAFIPNEKMHLCDCSLFLSSLHKPKFRWWCFTANRRTHFHLTDTSLAVKCKSLSSSPMNYELSVLLFFHKCIIWSTSQMCHKHCWGFPAQDISFAKVIYSFSTEGNYCEHTSGICTHTHNHRSLTCRQFIQIITMILLTNDFHTHTYTHTYTH